MLPYLAIPLSACLLATLVAAVILARDPRHRTNQLAAILVGGAALWSFFETLWAAAEEAETALWLVRFSTLGWVWFGPVGLHLFLELAGGREGRLHRALPWLYGVAAAYLAVALVTPWMHPRAIPTSWGWTYELGPAYWSFYPFTMGSLGVGFVHWLRRTGPSLSRGERRQLWAIVPGIAIPLFVGSTTDGILPALGIQPPRLGTISFACLGAVICWGFARHGYSVLAPGSFAREIVETLPDGVVLLRLDGRIRTANEGMARLVGCARDALEGRRVDEVVPGLPWKEQGEIRDLECELYTSQGTRIPVVASSTVLRDKQASPLGLVVVVRDLREVTALRSRLVTSGRLAAVGELAAGIAHEINNPISFVRSNLAAVERFTRQVAEAVPEETLAEAGIDVAEVRAGLEESIEGVDRVASIVRDVKGFAHAGRGTRELVDVNALLEATLRVAGPQIRTKARVERDLERVPQVAAAPQELKQVFVNLIVNAAQAIDGTGTIRVGTRWVGDFVEVHIDDDGAGIAPEVAERIFDPFFTTKDVGEGTGLGLAISHQIITNHDGDITIVSDRGRGTSVRVRLPAQLPGEAIEDTV